MSTQPNFLRRTIHHFIHGLCAVVIGITPPNEKQELPSFFILVGFLLFTAVTMYFVATVVPHLF